MIPLKQPTVPNPVPDLLYGYRARAFSAMQSLIQRSIDEQSDCCLSKTTRDLYWGFFIIEFKSQATGGTIWSATKQCAGAGAACTNALDRMLKAASGGGGGRDHSGRPDSISFSLAIDGQTASLHVHWHQEDIGDSFYCSRVRHYVLFEADGVRNLKFDVDSILEWGVKTRLVAIRSALDRSLINVGGVDPAVAPA